MSERSWLRYLLSCLIISVCSPFCSGQNNDLLFHHLRVQDGLSQAINWFAYKDSRGFVWISSLSGLNRFDGSHVRLFMPDITDPSSMLGENIQSNFYEDQDSNIWFTTLEAINKYNWDHDCFDHFQLTDSLGEAKTGYYIFYLDAFQNIWFLQNGQYLYTYNIPNGQYTFIGEVPTTAIRCRVVTNTSGHVSKLLLRGLGWPGIAVLDISASHIIGPPSYLPQKVGEEIKAKDGSVVDGDSAIWILTATHLIRHSWLSGEERILPVNTGQDVVRLNDSILLIGTANDGMLRFNTQTWQIVPVQTKNAGPVASLQSNNIRYITKDDEDNLWISVDGLGVSYTNIHKKKFNTVHLEVQHQKEIDVTPVSIFQDGPESILCFTQDDGVLQIDLRNGSFVTTPVDVINRRLRGNINHVAKDQSDHYWISTWSGLFVYNPHRMTMVPIADTIVCMSSQLFPDGSILFTTTSNALYRGYARQDGQCSMKLVVDRAIDGYPVRLDQKGRIWLNELQQRFAILDSSTLKPLASVPVNGLSSTMVTSQDGKTIWIACNTGLFEIDASTLEIRALHSTKTGFPATGISSMMMDDHGILWLGHYNGIISFDPASGRTRAYTQPDGLPSLEFKSAACRLDNGEFWFGSVGGLTRFYPDSIKDIQVKAIPQITELLINDRAPDQKLVCENTGATNITEIQKLCFDYKHNTLSFVVNALEYSAPEYNKVMYTMEGLDQGMINAPNGSTVRYPNMPPGTYYFNLYAFNSDGVENPEPRRMEIVIFPPFYKTWWFKMLAGLLVIGIISYIVYLRFSKALELQRVRLKLYENLHDDVGSRLTAIVLSAEDLERNENIQHPKLHAISQIARSIVGNMRRLVWAIDPENDSMNSLVQKITHDKSTILNDSIHFIIEMDPGLKNIIVPGEVRYQVSSICNEAFTNIMKYAQASSVHISITKEKGSLKLMIKDDGIGFAPAEKTKNALTGSGYGLANMQRRASRVGGTFSLTSKPNEGTTIEAKFPLS